MLNITAQSNSEGAKSYFAQSDYYSEGQEINGEWGGRGAVLLGLFGQVEKPAFDALCDNRHPQTGEQLTKITREGRRVGYDFTWSAPKSVSVVHALTGDESIMEAFRASIKETMGQMEADMQGRVRKGKNEHDRATGNLCWAEFVHLTSRPVNKVPCPQLHVHAYAFNATYDAIEGQWKAGQFGKIKGDAFYWQAVQQARFANRLQELGYSVRKTKNAFEIVGVPDSVLTKFSLRTGVIERAAEKLGITSAKSKAKLAATTREAKSDSIPYSKLVELWESQLTKEEAAAIGVVEQEKEPRSPAYRNDIHARFAVDHFFERASVADERRLLTLALRHGIGEVTPEGVRAEVNAHGLLKREEHGKVWVTTKGVLAEETKMISFAVAGKGSCRPLAKHGGIRFKEDRLNHGQRHAVEHVLTSSDKVMLIRGAAGTGKSTLTREAVAQIEERGKSVVMLAPSAQASRGVLRDEGFAEADTLARFLVDERMQAGANDGIIWLDEAGLVGSRTLASLFQLADRLHARVVLSGDKKQMASIERGAALRVLEDIAGLEVAEVTDIQRQKGDYKEVVKLLSMGQSSDGFAKLDTMGRVKVMPVWDSYEPIAKDYVEKWEQAPASEKDRAVLIVCPTHAEGAKITDAVRNELKAKGLLGDDEREFTRLVPLQWTEAERGDPRQYTGDEVVQFYHNVNTFKAGERVRAIAVRDRLGDVAAKHFSVFAAETIHLSPGDAIRITGNGKSLDGTHKLNNGAVYRVAGFTSDGDLSLSNGWVISKNFGQLAHGYVNTAQASQGRTVDHVLIAQSAMSYPASSQEGFYVAVSRGKRDCTIYTDDKRDLKAAIQRSSPRPSATELIRKPKPQFWRRMRRAIDRMQRSTFLAAKQAAFEIREAAKPRELAYER